MTPGGRHISDTHRFPPLPTPTTQDGQPRLCGVEIELGGLNEETCAKLCAEHLGGTAQQIDVAVWRVEDSRIGMLRVYLDTALRNTDPSALRDAALALGREVIPVEIVTEPLDRDGLCQLDDLREALRAAGAVGSGGGLLFGFGVHLNVQIASEDAAGVVPPLLAYALVEPWLRAAYPIDQTRRVLPFASPYPVSLVRRLAVLGPDGDLRHVADAYAQEAPSRNYGLDMLPVFAHLDPARVAPVLTETTTPRPAFHFRLPDCRIDEVDWSLDREWRRWLLVERVADDAALLARLSGAWRGADQGPSSSISDWPGQCGSILQEAGLAETPDRAP